MKIIYLHGFNSTGDSGTASFLKTIYHQAFLAPDYDYIDPDNAALMLDKIVSEAVNDGPVVMVGKSLGGFWANYFAEKYGLTCVLINPSLQPHNSLEKYLGVNRNFNNGKISTLELENVKSYAKYLHQPSKELYKHILLGAQDAVVDNSYCVSLMKDYLIEIFPDQDHYFNNYPAIADAIQRTIYNNFK